MVKAAVNPINAQIIGIIREYFGSLLLHKRIPNVKIVVGQGAPKVGELGYE